MRGRKPKPTETKKTNGTRNSRINFSEPDFTNDKNKTAPAHLGKIARQEWNRLYPELSGKGVLKITDRSILELYCESYQDYRDAKKILDRKASKTFRTPNGSMQQLAEVSIKRNAMTLCLKYASELGITPSSRSKISGEGAVGSGSKLKNFFLKGLKNAPKES